jgi:hypothetical protein
MSLYELAVLGAPTPQHRQALDRTLANMVGDFGLTLGDGVVVRGATTVDGRDPKAAFAAVYFGGARDPVSLAAAKALVRRSLPVIPVLTPDARFDDEIPDFLASANGIRINAADRDLREIAAALLECVGLLRRQRRAFVSYRRVEAGGAALQLHDRLAAHGFDVFLDTHAIRPGDPFQTVLWHRLCDSDVLLMLETPGYFDSRWTAAEFGRALAKEIHVLQVVWPGHVPARRSQYAEALQLESDDLVTPVGPLSDVAVDRIRLAVERLRSRSIAARHMSITGKLKAEAEGIGAIVEGVGAHRAISVVLPNGRRVWAYPAVGVPTADLFNDIADKALRGGHDGAPVLVYDHVGIDPRWRSHLEWLDTHIKVVRGLPVREAGWRLADWED